MSCHTLVICLSFPLSSAFHYLTLMHSPRFTNVLSLDFSEAKFRPAFKFPIRLCCVDCMMLNVGYQVDLFFVTYVKRNEHLFC